MSGDERSIVATVSWNASPSDARVAWLVDTYLGFLMDKLADLPGVDASIGVDLTAAGASQADIDAHWTSEDPQ